MTAGSIGTGFDVMMGSDKATDPNPFSQDFDFKTEQLKYLGTIFEEFDNIYKMLGKIRLTKYEKNKRVIGISYLELKIKRLEIVINDFNNGSFDLTQKLKLEHLDSYLAGN